MASGVGSGALRKGLGWSDTQRFTKNACLVTEPVYYPLEEEEDEKYPEGEDEAELKP